MTLNRLVRTSWELDPTMILSNYYSIQLPFFISLQLQNIQHEKLQFTKSHYWHFVILNLSGIASFLPLAEVKYFCHCRGIYSSHHSTIKHDIRTFWCTIINSAIKLASHVLIKFPFTLFFLSLSKTEIEKPIEEK